MPCTRCGGSGVLYAYLHCHGGICYRCNGSGVDPKETGLFSPEKIHQEKIVAGRKIILTTKRDPHGRFLGYSVYIEGAANQGVTCKNIRDANTAFQVLKRQVLAVKQ